MLDTISIDLRSAHNQQITVWVDVLDHGLSHKWLAALNNLLQHDYHLEKNYCWLGWATSSRNPEYICTQINRSIHAVNSADLGYVIRDFFSPSNTMSDEYRLNHTHLNQLHRYFEDLQGSAGAMSKYYTAADHSTRWHIRQLNLLCHELETLVMSIRKLNTAPAWQRPSQLRCWLNAPRFELTVEDYDQFGIQTINRSLGGVYVGVNKAVGKHHWEVFNDEGRDSRVSELITTSLKSQTQAAGDFDIEWANDPGSFPWQIQLLEQFREWLLNNNFDPDDKSLTIGHPKVAQVDLMRSFGTTDYTQIWAQLSHYQDVYQISTSTSQATYEYHWSDPDYEMQQIRKLT